MKPSFSFILPLLTTFPLTSCATTPESVSTNKTSWTGTLSSLDGGLGGTIAVITPTQLLITNYQLEDPSAPALYWWGSATADLAAGFRISNKQVKEVAPANKMYTIELDAGKTTGDFGTVGLWCERFSANFGQAVLVPPEDAVDVEGGGAGGASPSSTTVGGGMRSNANGGTVGWMLVGAGAGVVAILLM